MVKMNEISFNDDVVILHPITKQKMLCRVLDKNIETDEVLVSLGGSGQVFKKIHDILEVKK